MREAITFESKLNHSFVVGKVMELMASEVFKEDAVTCKDMFLLGYIHDCLFDFENDEILRSEQLANLLPEIYSDEIRNQAKIDSEALSYTRATLLLYFANSIVKENGEIASFDERLEDILVNDGKKSAKNAEEIVEALKSFGYGTYERICLNAHEIFDANLPTEMLYTIYANAKEQNVDGTPDGFFKAFVESSMELFRDCGCADRVQGVLM